MNALHKSLLAFVLYTCSAIAHAADPFEVKLAPTKPGDDPVVEVVGIAKADLDALAKAKLSTEEWAKVARLVVERGTEAEVAKKPAIAGEWSVNETALRFEPQFPLVPGLKYRVICDLRAAPRGSGKGEAFSVSFTVPKPPPGPRVQLLRVYPSANRLPENTLRLYIHFSGVVQRGDVYSRFKLVRDDGKEIEHPFVELDEELWSADGSRLTLLFDPGRVKRGLTPREEHGPILEEGRSYTLIVDASWPDAEGRPLLTTFKKQFGVTAPDDEPIWPDEWKLIPPRAGTDAPVLIRLAKPLDHALLHRMLWVQSADGKLVEGTLSVGGGERVISFAPKHAWGKGDYRLVIDETLEDICGNRVGVPFEVDVFKPIPLRPVEQLTERTFTVK